MQAAALQSLLRSQSCNLTLSENSTEVSRDCVRYIFHDTSIIEKLSRLISHHALGLASRKYGNDRAYLFLRGGFALPPSHIGLSLTT